jgi:hypothetical protein
MPCGLVADRRFRGAYRTLSHLFQRDSLTGIEKCHD